MTSASNLADASEARILEQITLIRRVAAGEECALSSLYEATSRLLYGLLLRMLNDTGAAEEVLLDVYTQVWRQAAQYDRRRGTPLGWLTTIARSRAIDRLRAGRGKQRRHEPLDLSVQTATTENLEEALATRETQRIVRAALGGLPPEQREAIELAYYVGLSHSEIAAETGQPLGTVKTRIRLGMVRLREALKPAGKEES